MALKQQNIPCGACEGTGSVKNNRGSTSCPHCRGTGEMPHRQAGTAPDQTSSGQGSAGVAEFSKDK